MLPPLPRKKHHLFSGHDICIFFWMMKKNINNNNLKKQNENTKRWKDNKVNFMTMTWVFYYSWFRFDSLKSAITPRIRLIMWAEFRSEFWSDCEMNSWKKMWYRTNNLNPHKHEKILARILMVREVQEHMLADAASSS